ncbi:MAG: hypothetical protein M3Y08_20235, partial [Fibrobacterota bacterium]|nr:hypothetical protein [Fibrobacterota bacterium]
MAESQQALKTAENGPTDKGLPSFHSRPGPWAFTAAIIILGILLPSLLLSGCYFMRPGHGGGKASAPQTRITVPGDIALPKGYRIEAIATGLTFPTAVAMDDTGGLYVLEGGYAYGEEWGTPRLLKVMKNNMYVAVAVGDSNGPWTGFTYVPAQDGGKGNGSVYLAEGGQLRGGRILRVGMDGSIEALVENLPSYGDHHTNGPA